MRDVQWRDRLQSDRTSGWLKRSIRKFQYRGTGGNKSAKAPRSPIMEAIDATDAAADSVFGEREVDREKGLETLDLLEREIVSPWEAL